MSVEAERADDVFNVDLVFTKADLQTVQDLNAKV